MTPPGCVWTCGTSAAAAGAAAGAEAARIVPAALSAKTAGMMMSRPMRMIASTVFTEVSGPLQGSFGPHGAYEAG